MKFLYIICTLFILISCMKGQKVDLIIHNGIIYSANDAFEVLEAIAIKDGKIVELGPNRQILNKYRADEIIDAQGKDILPSFTDAHGHIMSLIQQHLTLDLTKTKSEKEMLFELEKYAANNNKKYILARGWDQANWKQKNFPTNLELNKLFPDIPVLLIRVDGHAAIANDFLLKKANLSQNSSIEGGKVVLENEIPTGIILDNAIDIAQQFIPKFNFKEKKTAFLEIQELLLEKGLLQIHEAGLSFEDLAFLKKINEDNLLKINIYGMLYPSTENISWVRKNGIYKKNKLCIRSFKIVGDGALGSRGACLKHPYEDDIHTFGFLTTPIPKIKEVIEIALAHNFQVNTHAIGDSTNIVIMELYQKAFQRNPDHRWRIEHAQVIDVKDFHLLAKYAIFPSVQPTHAVSDYRWAEDRIGKKRLQGAYAYKDILKQTNIMCLGTDFPIESFDPFATIHAAINRQNRENIPINGFLTNQALNLEECIKGMTIWAAFASFNENNQGSLEKGKEANLIVLEYPLKTKTYKENFAYLSFSKGKKVYSLE